MAKNIVISLVLCVISYLITLGYLLGPAWEIDFGSDRHQYFLFFDSLSHLAITESITFYEPAFSTLAFFLHYFTDFNLFLWILFYIFMCSLFLSLYRISESFFISALSTAILVFLFPPYFSLTQVVLRQGLCTSIFLLIVSSNRNQEFRSINASPTWFILPLFHYSSVFIVFSRYLAGILPRQLILWAWAIAMLGYIFDYPGYLMSSIVESFIDPAVLKSSIKVFDADEYILGFKPLFLISSVMPIVVIAAYAAFQRKWLVFNKSIHSSIGLTYLLASSFATFFSFMPFNDRFFLWSWSIAPHLIFKSIFISNDVAH